MKIWALKLLTGAAALLVTAAPVAVEQDTEMVDGAIPTAAAVASDHGHELAKRAIPTADQGREIVQRATPTAAPALPCEGSKFGCWPKLGGTCVIRYGKFCEKLDKEKDQCNLDHPVCAASATPGPRGQT